ncbi:MAG: Ig-like domain-containing protein [Lachnospiraceae bacterium]
MSDHNSYSKESSTDRNNRNPCGKNFEKRKSFTLKPVLAPAGVTAKLTYTTSNRKVAVVTSKGKVTAKGKGSAVITVKTGKLIKKCRVTVK